MRAVDLDVVTSNPKAHTFVPLKEHLIQRLVPRSASKYSIVPFDIYCPSMQKKLNQGICSKCRKYWPSKAALNRHMSYHKEDEKTPTTEPQESNTEDQVVDEEFTGEAEQMPVFENTFDIFKSQF